MSQVIMNYIAAWSTEFCQLVAANTVVASTILAFEILMATALFYYISLYSVLILFSVQFFFFHEMTVENRDHHLIRKSMLYALFILVRAIKWISASHFFNGILIHFISLQLIMLFSVIGIWVEDENVIAGKLLVMCAMLFYVNSFDLFVSSWDNLLMLRRLITLLWIPLFIFFEVMLLNDSVRATNVFDACLKLALVPFVVMPLMCIIWFPYLIQYILIL